MGSLVREYRCEGAVETEASVGGVGQEVKRLREARGWIQAKLAVEAGMAPSAVNQIENGKRSPSASSLSKLARALDVEVADLFPKAQAPLPDFEDERRETRLGDDRLVMGFSYHRKLLEKDLEAYRALLENAPRRQEGPERDLRVLENAIAHSIARTSETVIPGELVRVLRSVDAGENIPARCATRRKGSGAPFFRCPLFGKTP